MKWIQLASSNNKYIIIKYDKYKVIFVNESVEEMLDQRQYDVRRLSVIDSKGNELRLNRYKTMKQQEIKFGDLLHYTLPLKLFAGNGNMYVFVRS